VILAALVGGTLADAQPQTPLAESPHLLVVPDTPEGEAALARSDARVVARYGTFSLVEAAGSDEVRLRRAGADRRDDMRRVRTAAGDVDPATERPALAAKEGPERDEVLALVQFVGPVKDAWLERVRATGARLVTYQAENSYVVHANGDEVDALAALAGSYPPVRAVAALTAADKLESPKVQTGRYAVQTVSGAEGADARDEAAATGAAVGRSVAIDALHTQYLALSAAEAADLARDPAVVTVEPYAEPRLADERGAQIVAGNLSGFGPSGPGYLDWLVDDTRIPNDDTFHFAIDVTDEGLDGGLTPPAHPDFSSRISYLNNYSSDAGADAARDCGGHGTNVASIAAGNNNASGSLAEDSAGYNYGLGVAPFAQLGASKVFNCARVFTSGFSAATLASQAYDAGARISNNSWGTGDQVGWGDYNALARQYDALVRDASSGAGNQELVEVFAAGNDGEGNPGDVPNEGYGTILAEGTAKNVITVGAAEGVRPFGLDGCGVADSGADSARDIIDFSSRGPTDDGRLKPDLVAPGTHMVGARPSHSGYTGNGACVPFFAGTSAFYSMISGSSQAAPQVSGAAALVRHWYERTEGANPSPALTKALLINTATDLAGGSTGKGATIAAGRNTDQGWGRVNVGAALDPTPREYRDQDAADTFAGPGATRSVTYAVQNAAKPVKVTLVWTDAPGPASGSAWVNNLDLEVEARGNRYLGNVFAGALSRTGGSADTRNNVESVYLPPGTTGRFTVSVKSITVGGDGVPGVGDSTDQDYALVVSNADEQPAPVLVQAGTMIDDPGPGGDSDGILESGESVEMTQLVRNSGSVTADGISAGLTGSPGFDVTHAASSYLTLAPGTTDTNDPPFKAGLAKTATCGAEIQPTLDITTTTPLPETHTIPLVLPTGEAGPPLDTNAAASQLQLPIPDDSGAGVSSTLFVSQRGRIKDLDVRLPGTAAEPGIEHDFVGDVVIDLIGPDGTTVRLAEHPGGPDNSMKDFQDVTFDDEAARPIGDPAAPPQLSYDGPFRPQNDQLSRFDGKDRRGTWTLRVRDLFEIDTGTLRAWGVTSQRALCDFDTAAPATRLLTQPAASTDDTSPSFGFDSPDDAGAVFECRLDAGEYEPCASTKTYGGLALGQHTFYVRAVDGSGNEDASPEVFAWTVVDSVAPVVTLTEPTNGSSTTDSTPRLAGVAGTLAGDDATVTLRLWTGSLAVGLPVQTLIVPRDGAGGGFSAVPSALTEGTYTARAEQGDSALPSENVGVSAPVTFTVRTPPPAAPSFALAQAEERLSDALADRYTVLAACAAACRVSAKLSVSASSARRLGLSARATAIGEGTKRLARAGASAVRVGLTATARKALREQVSSTATLNVIVADSAGATLVLKRKVTLHRSAGLERIAGRGMSLWSVCSEDCSLRGALRISAAKARKLGVKPTPVAGSSVAIAAGRADSGALPAKLTLRVPAKLRKTLRGAGRLTARLEASAGASGTSRRKASRRLTLR
jgi:subtilisin-like proprotein convertase family protein/subtilisin family serine protease